MRNIPRKIETAANIAIILVALSIGAVIVSRTMFPPATNATTAAKNLPIGFSLPLDGVDWAAIDKTLVMVLSAACKFCIESTPFYQELSKTRQASQTGRLLAVMPQPVEESEKYLKEKRIRVDSLRSVPLSDLQVNGTPTLILVDSSGKVVNSWVGKLPPEKEEEVISAVFGNATSH